MRRAARLLALAGALGVGWLLLGTRPHDVVLVYDVSAVPSAALVDVKISRHGELVRRAELRVDHRAQVRHPVRLQSGRYLLGWRVVREGVLPPGAGIVQGERELAVEGDQTIVLPLGP